MDDVRGVVVWMELELSERENGWYQHAFYSLKVINYIQNTKAIKANSTFFKKKRERSIPLSVSERQ